MEVWLERGYIINFLQALKKDGSEVVNFISPTGAVRRVELKKIRDKDALFSFLEVKPGAIRYYPLDHRPYMEVKVPAVVEPQKFYIEKTQ